MFRRLLFTLLILSGVAHATVLTLTAVNLTVHNGDGVPPVTFIPTGYAGSDTWTSAVASGYPVCTTTYTPTSPNGTYPTSCTIGTMVANGAYAFNFVNGTLTVESANGTGALNVAVPRQPSGMMQNVTVSNGTCAALVPDGVTDNTAAFNCLLHTGRTGQNTYGNFPKQFYFPGGTSCSSPNVYLVSGQIVTYGSAEMLTGDGPCLSIIKLAAASTGYTSGATAADWIYFSGAIASGSNNNGYNQQIENLGFEVGPGNPGTIAISFLGNNVDALYNDKVWFDDGQGIAGIATDHAYPGQTLVKNFSVYGGGICDRAINEQEYNMVFENLTCENQNTYAISTGGYQTSVRNFFSVNTVPAWNNTNGGDVLINGECIGGGSGNCLQNAAAGTMYVRNMTCTGYANCIVDSNGSVTLTGSFAEHWSGTAQTLFSTAPPTGVIITPVLETPVANDPVDGTGTLIGTALSYDPTTWTATANTCPASGVLYVPVHDNYTASGVDSSNNQNYTGKYTPGVCPGNIPFSIPSCINHVLFNNMAFPSGCELNITTTGTSSTPLVLDHVTSTASAPTVTQNSTRAIEVSDMFFYYFCATGAGSLFMQDAEISNNTTLAKPTFCPGQSIWGRAFDQESLGPDTAVGSIGYVSATSTMTLTGAGIDPNMVVGDIIYLSGLSPSTWINGSSIIVTSITGSGTGTITGIWSFSTHADQASTSQTAGNYRTQYQHVICTSCNIWLLGYKTEDAGILLNVTSGNVEVDGGFWYVVRDPGAGTTPFSFTNTNAFVTGSMFHSCCTHEPFWQYWVIETQGAVTRNLSNPQYPQNGALANMNMYYSIGGGAPPSPFPTKFFGGKLTGDSVH